MKEPFPVPHWSTRAPTWATMRELARFTRIEHLNATVVSKIKISAHLPGKELDCLSLQTPGE